MTKTEKQTILTWLQMARKDYKKAKERQGDITNDRFPMISADVVATEASYNTLAGLASVLGIISPSERFKED